MSSVIRSALLATFLASPAFGDELSRDSLARVAPMAEQAGFGPGASMLADEAFALVEPDAFAALERARAPELARENLALAAARSTVEHALGELGAEPAVSGRLKSMYSLHAKMRARDLPMHAVLDRVALRVLVDDEAEAYTVREHLRECLAVLPGSEDDYIAAPKPSGYQALHLAARDAATGLPFEVQIRTRAAHAAAEHGPAAHWRYKLG